MANSSNVECLFADAYAFIEQGLCYDEINDKENARQMYERGLEIGDQALKIDDQKSGNLRNGFVNVRQLVDERVANIKNKIEINQEKIDEIRCKLDSTGDLSVGDAELFYWLPDGVQLVIIENSKTNAPSPPSSLAIFKFKQPNEIVQKSEKNSVATFIPSAFIQIGPWCYPLSKQTSIMKNELGVYVVPNPTKEHPDMFVGIILPRGIEPRLEEEFIYALQQFSELKSSNIVEEMSQEQRQRTSDRIAQFLIQTGEYLAKGTQDVAKKTGEYMNERGEQYRANMEPTDQPVNINPAIRNGVFVLHKGSKVVAKVTRLVLDKIGDVGIAVGQKVASSLSGESGGGRVFKSTTTVIGGGITAVSTVWMSLEDASKTLMRCLANETVQTVNLRYGDEASQTTHHALHAVGHTTLAGFQLYELGPRAIAGRMARKAGLQFVQGVSSSNTTSSSVRGAQIDGKREEIVEIKTVSKK